MTGSTAAKLAHLEDELGMLKQEQPERYAILVEGMRMAYESLRLAISALERALDKVDAA